MKPKIHEAKFLRSITRVSEAPTPLRPSVAFAGRSNVGKSSLLNALVRHKGLARTSSTPGRTQSIVYFGINERFYFIDLPGYGYAKVPMKVRARWGPMVEKFLTQVKELRLVIVILDARRDPSDQDLELVEWLDAAGLAYFFALTKADKLGRNALAKRSRAIQERLALKDADALLPFSAVTGTGHRELLGVIFDALNADTLEEAGGP